MRHTLGFIALFIFLLYGAKASAGQVINFTEIMPDEFEFCGEKIGPDTEAYKSLYNWFNDNTMGWYGTTRKYDLDLVFMASTMRVNMTHNKVIVSYAASGVGLQHVKAAKTSGFKYLCK